MIWETATNHPDRFIDLQQTKYELEGVTVDFHQSHLRFKSVDITDALDARTLETELKVINEAIKF